MENLVNRSSRLGLVGVVALLLVGCPSEDTPGLIVVESDVPKDAKVDGFADGRDVVDPPRTCMADTDCAGMDGQDACHSARCDRSTGLCQLATRPGCCVRDSDCDDQKPNTTDRCDPEKRTCIHIDVTSTCQGDLDCDPKQACVAFQCEKALCVTWSKPDCCTTDAQCDDANGCTTDRCQAARCVHAPSADPACCTNTLIQESFDNGSLGALSTKGNGQAALWHVSKELSHSPGGSARFADPKTSSYGNPPGSDGAIPASMGWLLLPPTELPKGSPVTLTFWLWLDIEALPKFDFFRVEAWVQGSDDHVLLWEKSALTVSQYRTWTLVTIPAAKLASLAGKKTVIGFQLDTLDGTKNEGKGAFVDDIVLAAGCAAIEDCKLVGCKDDGDVCTQELCGDAGICRRDPIPGCCNGDGDCPQPGAPCAQARCKEHKCLIEAVPGCCVSDQQCADKDPCTLDRCTSAGCIHEPMPDCQTQCKEDFQCNDNDKCTLDLCLFIGSGLGICTHEPIPGCNTGCKTSADCNDGNPCTEDVCLFDATGMPSCVHKAIPGCGVECKSAQDCDDKNTCTKDGCEGGKCVHFQVPGCVVTCKDGLLWAETFESSGKGWSLSPPKNGVGWRVGAFGLAGSPKQALYYGNPETKSYATAEQQNSGAAIFPPVTLPKGAAAITLSFLVYADIEADPSYDLLRLRATGQTTGEAGILWDKTQVQGGIGPQWVPVSVDLTALQGTTVAMGFEFDTVDGILNDTLGVFIDDLELSVKCGGGGCGSTKDCDDQNPCTVDQCTNTGVCAHLKVGDCTPCKINAQCEDKNACTIDTCDLNKNLCVHLPAPGCCASPVQCNDGDPCTTDQCLNGKCTWAKDPNCGGCMADWQCEDGNACTVDQCFNGACFHQPLPGCAFCDADFMCDDGNPCTWDACDTSQKLCVYKTDPNCAFCMSDTQCNDGNACTKDWCQNGQCQYATAPNCCTASSQCNDGNPCTKDGCLGNQCIHEALPDCCAPTATGVPTSCDDKNPCTKDTCQNNVCLHVTVPGCCTTDAACNDQNPCTKDACQNNVCVAFPSGGPGCCLSAKDCEDGDPCTDHACAAGACTTTPKPDCCAGDAQCEDGVKCTKNACVNGSCTTTSIPGCCSSNGDCNDQVACTTDTCDAATGTCKYGAKPGCCTLDAHCKDASACTTDVCVNNACQHTQIVGCCSSAADCQPFAGACQTASCTANQCVFSPVPGCCTTAADCEDGNACTTHGCNGGQCVTKTVPNCCTSDAACADTDPCTKDACQQSQCVHVKDPNCCVPKTVFSDTFEQQQTWKSAPQGESQWQLSKSNSLSPYISWWFGNGATGTYANSDQSPSQGTLQSSPIALPAGAYLLLTFGVWLDLEPLGGFDNLTLEVQSSNGTSTLVWDRSAAPQMGTWAKQQVNLSKFAGQTVTLRFVFDTVDGMFNDTKGVYLDDVNITTSCTPLTGLCALASDCDDKNQCTTDTCNGGTCAHAAVAGCCQSAKDCDDAYVCTVDACGPGGQCTHQQKAGCCAVDFECDDGDSCTKDACAQNACTHTFAGGAGCCTTDAQCDDQNGCTKDFCQGGHCSHFADTGPQCCTAATLLSASFDDKTLGGFTILKDTSGAYFSLQAKRAFSPAVSLYYGVPGQWTTATPNGGPSNGRAMSPYLTVPLTVGSATLSFAVWLDGAQDPFFGDQLTARVLSGTTLETLWTQAQQDPGTFGGWTVVTVDLSKYKGKTIQVHFEYTSPGQQFGGGFSEGAYLDDIEVTTSCTQLQ